MRHFHDYVGRPSLKRNPSGSSEGGSEGSFYLEREVCFVWLWSKEGLWRLLLWLCFLKKWKGCDELARHQRRRPFGSFVLLSLNQRAFTASLQLRKADEATISQIVYFWKLKCYKCIVNSKKTVIFSKTPKMLFCVFDLNWRKSQSWSHWNNLFVVTPKPLPDWLFSWIIIVILEFLKRFTVLSHHPYFVSFHRSCDVPIYQFCPKLWQDFK